MTYLIFYSSSSAVVLDFFDRLSRMIVTGPSFSKINTKKFSFTVLKNHLSREKNMIVLIKIRNFVGIYSIEKRSNYTRYNYIQTQIKYHLIPQINYVILFP